MHGDSTGLSSNCSDVVIQTFVVVNDVRTMKLCCVEIVMTPSKKFEGFREVRFSESPRVGMGGLHPSGFPLEPDILMAA